MFSMAFLAQFIEPTVPQLPQFLVLMTASSVVVALVLGAYVVLAAKVSAQLQSIAARKRMGYAGDSSILGGSAVMAMTR